MARPKTTEIRIDEHGDETHESWLLIRANRCTGGGSHLFDSEIRHQSYITVTVSRCSRKRDLNHDWLMDTKLLIEINMSEAQWGAFVSSFGHGTGVPATLDWFDGARVPRAPHTPRLEESHKEVRNAGAHALEKIRKAQEAVQEAFDQNLGKKVLRERLHHLQCMVNNGPGTMEFAATSLTEHVENVVTKARADIEGMVLGAQARGASLNAGDLPLLEIEEDTLGRPVIEGEATS